MVFCNKVISICITDTGVCHNPYFNRWFSAMWVGTLVSFDDAGHNPYFNRWFSAIKYSFNSPTDNE